MNFLIFAVFCRIFVVFAVIAVFLGVCCVRGFWRQMPVYTLM